MNELKTNALSIGLGGIAAVSLLMTGGQAHAQAACSADTTVATVMAPGFSCMLGNGATFSNFDITGAPLAATLAFGVHESFFTITLGRDGTFFPDGRLVFDYEVTAPANQTIATGTVGVDVSVPEVITVVRMNGEFLNPSSLTNGGTALIRFVPPVDSVLVDNTARINADGQLSSISNDFSQSEFGIGVPEPASLSLFGLGLLGLGFARRRHS